MVKEQGWSDHNEYGTFRQYSKTLSGLNSRTSGSDAGVLRDADADDQLHAVLFLHEARS